MRSSVEKVKGFFRNLKHLPIKTKWLLSLGVVLSLTLALPIFIWGITNLTFELREKAQTPTSIPLTIQEAFSGTGSIDSSKWGTSGSVGFSAVLENDALKLSVPAGSSQSGGKSAGVFPYVDSKIPELTGDFDTSVNLNPTDMSAGFQELRFGPYTIAVRRNKLGDSETIEVWTGDVASGKYTNKIGSYGLAAGTGPVKVRLARTGSTVQAYYNLNLGEADVPLASAEIAPGSYGSESLPSLVIENSGPEYPAITALFDNYYAAVSIQAPAPASPTPTAVACQVCQTSYGEINTCVFPDPQTGTVSNGRCTSDKKVAQCGETTYCCIKDYWSTDMSWCSPFPSPTRYPSPSPTPICKTGVGSFSVDTPCENNGFRYMTFKCYDGFGRREGSTSSCKSSATWRSYAEQYCKGRSSCPSSTPIPTRVPTPTATSTPTCSPRPSCLDSIPRCLLPEPEFGWCPSTPTPTPTGGKFCPAAEACPVPNQTYLLRNCHPPESDNTPQESLCSSSFVGRVEICGTNKYCCNGTSWTTNLTACSGETSIPVPTGSPTTIPIPTATATANARPVITTYAIRPLAYIRRSYSATLNAYDRNLNDNLLVSVTGLPRGLNYACNVSGRNDSRQMVSCKIYGTPTTTGFYQVGFVVNDQRGGIARRYYRLLVTKLPWVQ